MNAADSQRLASSLEKLGYQSTAIAEEADVIVLNTCVVRQSAEDRAYGRLQSLRHLKSERPNVVINLMGCLVGVKGNPKLQATFPHVDVFSPPSDPEPLLQFLGAQDDRALELLETESRFAVMDEELVLPVTERHLLVSAHVPAVLGCSFGCTYCVIPYRRGTERSRPAGTIVAEVRSLAEQGVREVTLLGQIIDRYGKDFSDGPDLSGLLRQVQEVEGIERIRFLTSHPNWFNDRLLETIAELPKVCEHIEIPIQAGNDEILEQMRRGYTVDQYRALIERIRQRLPEASIATDIIVGFPGESEAQFQDTAAILEELRMDVAHLARYSARPGTIATRRMQDDVAEEVKMRRFRQVEQQQAQIAGEINARYLGQTVEVLVEDKKDTRWRGRTRNNKLVFFEDPADWRGSLVTVRIEWTGPWSMRGQLQR